MAETAAPLTVAEARSAHADAVTAQGAAVSALEKLRDSIMNGQGGDPADLTAAQAHVDHAALVAEAARRKIATAEEAELAAARNQLAAEIRDYDMSAALAEMLADLETIAEAATSLVTRIAAHDKLAGEWRVRHCQLNPEAFAYGQYRGGPAELDALPTLHHVGALLQISPHGPLKVDLAEAATRLTALAGRTR